MAPVALAHNVGSPAEVDDALASALAAGGTVVVHAQVRDWGGYSGYFADPDGFRWEVAHNPGLVVSDDGAVTFVTPEPDPGPGRHGLRQRWARRNGSARRRPHGSRRAPR
ncbi:VOC family protein [Oerskovia sp. M15]